MFLRTLSNARPVNLVFFSPIIAVRRQFFFIIFTVEKVLSGVAVVTRIVDRTFKENEIIGKQI